MRCNKCNNEIPDDSLFCSICGEPINKNKGNNTAPKCPKCGADINNNKSFCSMCGANLQTETKIKDKNKSYLPLLLIIAAVVIVIGLFIAIMMKPNNKKEEINLNDYVSVEISGYEGYGRALINLDTDELSAKFIESYSLNEKETETIQYMLMDGLGVTDYASANYFIDNIGECTFNNNIALKNGDVITASWNNLSGEKGELLKEKLEQGFNISLKAENFDYEVKDLEPIEEIDIFDGVDISTEGIEETSNIRLVSNMDDDYIINAKTDLYTIKNGDTIIIEAAPKDYDGWDEYTENTGKKPKTVTTETIVKDLGILITNSNQIPDEYFEKIKSEGSEEIKKYIYNAPLWGDHSYFVGHSDPKFIGSYIFYSREIATNKLINVYEIENDIYYNNFGFKISDDGTATDTVYLGYVTEGPLVIDSNNMFTDSKKASNDWVLDNEVISLSHDCYDLNGPVSFIANYYPAYESVESLENKMAYSIYDGYDMEKNIQ